MKEFPGPGKYENIDMMGSGRNFYNSKYKTQKQKSFNGGDRFFNCKACFTQKNKLLGPATTPSPILSSLTASTSSPI
jgi:hypothetical protein